MRANAIEVVIIVFIGGCSSGGLSSVPFDMAAVPTATGKACARNADCPSMLCVPIGNNNGSVCTTSCASASDCVPGWSCATAGTESVCTCTSMPELCNGKDDNCDGVIDEEPAASINCVQTRGAGWRCQSGQCVCGSLCAGVCVDPQTDPANCGSCGNRCAENGSCVAGVCGCGGGLALCGKSCVDLGTDAANCGGCQRACTGGMVCSGGACACPKLLTSCNGRCVDVNGDPSNCGGCGVACPSGNGCVGGACKAIPQFQYVIDSILLPMSPTDYAIDLNGDGHLDNQLGNIIGALTALGFDVQSQENMALMNGSTIELIAVQTMDPLEQNDPAAVTVLNNGVAMPMPDFSGMGHFTIDTTQPTADFHGALQQGSYSSESPVTTHSPVSLSLSLSLFTGTPTPLPVHGAHIQYQVSGTGLINGKLQGSIKNADIQLTVIPGIAALLNSQIAANPNSPTSKQIRQLFDAGDGNGGNCTNPDGTIGRPNDGIISPCEVADNNIIMNVLAPDVQIYDGSGNYAPNPANTNRDSLSIGIGFTAVRATF